MFNEYDNLPAEPTEGMPCTVGIGSDSYGHKVAKVLSPKRIQLDDGWVWSKRKDGRWRPKGSGKNSGYSLTLGIARDYRDPSF